MRSPPSSVPQVTITAGVVVHCSQCGLLDAVHVGRPGADLAAREHLASHAKDRSTP